MSEASDALYAVVRTIPAGRVAGYGAVGRVSARPVSGFVAGQLMARCPEDVPWWRVVGGGGDLLIGKRSPHLAAEQRARLEAEGVGFDAEGRVERRWFWDDLA